MRQRHHGNYGGKKANIIKIVKETPSKFRGRLCPTNLEEEKEKFLKYGLLPQFSMRESPEEMERISSRRRAQIRFDLLSEAKNILDTVKSKYGNAQEFLEAHYGPMISQEEAINILDDYLMEQGLVGEMTVYWTSSLTSSARMMWHGPSQKRNHPEARQFTLIIKNTPENSYLRERGLLCLLDHEIGTHYYRMFNDGYQPWFSDRKKFGLRTIKARESVATEEGLASINTALSAYTNYLWTPALLYYTACKAVDMTFRELFDHIGMYTSDQDTRWRLVMRVKRALLDPNDYGGSGSDQCYFEGAVQVLRNLDTIDLEYLYCGKICTDETKRIRRLARTDCLRLPRFIGELEKYKKSLRNIAYTNGLVEKPIKRTGSIKKSTNEQSEAVEPVSSQTEDPAPPYSRGLLARSRVGISYSSVSDLSLESYSPSLSRLSINSGVVHGPCAFLYPANPDECGVLVSPRTSRTETKEAPVSPRDQSRDSEDPGRLLKRSRSRQLKLRDTSPDASPRTNYMKESERSSWFRKLIRSPKCLNIV